MDIFVDDDKFQTVGEPISVGMELPHFKLVDAEGNKIKTADLLGKVTLISVIPNIKTGICALQTKHFNSVIDKYSDINFITVSTNTVAEQSEWCAAEGVTSMKMLSDEEESFGYAMNLYVPATAFDARSIYIIDEKGTVVYRQMVEITGTEPDYADAQAKLDEILAK